MAQTERARRDDALRPEIQRVVEGSFGVHGVRKVWRHSLHRAPREAGIEPSVGSVGDSYDDALAERINGLFKADVIHRRGPWRNFEAMEFATLEWRDWFNNSRLLEPTRNIPSAEAEKHCCAELETRSAAAWDSNQTTPGKPGAVQRY